MFYLFCLCSFSMRGWVEKIYCYAMLYTKMSVDLLLSDYLTVLRFEARESSDIAPIDLLRGKLVGGICFIRYLPGR